MRDYVAQAGTPEEPTGVSLGIEDVPSSAGERPEEPVVSEPIADHTGERYSRPITCGDTFAIATFAASIGSIFAGLKRPVVSSTVSRAKAAISAWRWSSYGWWRRQTVTPTVLM